MSRLKDIVKINKKFQKSINMRLDYNQLDKIQSYIPTRASMQVLKQYLYQISQNKGDKSTILIGPYGKGKSHLLLVLLALVSRANISLQIGNRSDDIDVQKAVRDSIESGNSVADRQEVIKALVEKVRYVDSDAGDYAEQLVKSQRPYLPVLVSNTNGDLGKAFLLALKEGLERDGLEALVPHTYFDEAISTIVQWKAKYVDTYEKFKKYLREEKIEEAAFMKCLKKYDEKALIFFQEIYPKLTSGGVFEPMVQMDVMTLYKSVNETLCTEYGYGGIVLVFDEFSKFVEGYPKERFSGAMEQLQNICELANHTKEQALHVILVAHKAMKEYKNILPKEVINAYTGVEGRIGEIRFTVSLQNSYELIQNAIYKEEALFEKEVAVTEKFRCVQSESYVLPYFHSAFSKEEFETIVMRGCFPLTPVAAYLLLKISEKAVQNERTVFTFIAHEERYSMAHFIQEQREMDSMYVTAGRIYDYFSSIFKNDNSNVTFHNEWLKAEYALSRINAKEKVEQDVHLQVNLQHSRYTAEVKNVQAESEKEVIKTVALIRMVGKQDDMLAKDDVIRLGAGLELEEYKRVMECLKREQILLFRSRTHTYSFKNNIGVDIEKEINQVKNVRFQKINLCAELEKVSELEYELPKRYNQKYTMTRYFRYQFMTVENFLRLSKAEYLFEDKFADGKIIALVKTEEVFTEEIIAHLKQLEDERIVVIEPREIFSQEDNLKKILAIRYLKADEEFLEHNKALEQELNLYEEDLLFEVNAALEQYYLPLHGNCTVLYGTKQYKTEAENMQKVDSRFNQLLSHICEQYYCYAPRINNELINKRQLTTQMKKARTRIIENILGEKNFSVYCKGTTPEATIFRAVFVKTGLVKLRDEEKILSYEKDEGVLEVLEEIRRFMEGAAGKKQCFSLLYDILQGKKFGVRKGILPLYLSYGFSLWTETPVIYLGAKEVQLDVRTIENINQSPEQYYLYMEKQTVEKEKYLAGLERLFLDMDRKWEEKKKNKNRLLLLSDSIHNWYCSLPQCSTVFSIPEESEQRQEGLRVFRSMFRKLERNPREVLLEKLPNAFGTSENYEQLLKDITFIKKEMEGYIETVKISAIDLTKEVFGFGKKDDLLQCLRGWYLNQSSQAKHYVHTRQIGRFMNGIENMSTHNEKEIVEILSKIVLDLYIEDWKENSLSQYVAELQKIKEEIEQLAEEENVEGKQRIIFTNSRGQEIERHFKIEEDEDGNGQFLQNEIESALEEFGDSLETNQKVSIMVKMIEKLLEEV